MFILFMTETQSFDYDFKHKFLIISNIKKINNQCKNGCKINVSNSKIKITANNKNTILYAYELIKKVINNIENKVEKKEKLLVEDNSFKNKYDVLENNIIEFINNNTEKPQTKVYQCKIEEKKEDRIYTILNNKELSEEEKKSNKIALELLEEEERIKRKKEKRKLQKQRRKEKLKSN